MATQRLIVAIGRIERALSRLEQMPLGSQLAASGEGDLAGKHEQLKAETRAAIADIDALLAGQS
jgi:hypothetical protein